MNIKIVFKVMNYAITKIMESVTMDGTIDCHPTGEGYNYENWSAKRNKK